MVKFLKLGVSVISTILFGMIIAGTIEYGICFYTVSGLVSAPFCAICSGIGAYQDIVTDAEE